MKRVELAAQNDDDDEVGGEGEPAAAGPVGGGINVAPSLAGSISGGEGTPIAIPGALPDVNEFEEHHDEVHDQIHPLPRMDDVHRTESDGMLSAPDYYGRQGRRAPDSDGGYGGRTPRQGRSRSRSRAREVRASSTSRSGSPHVGAKKPKAFAFFGHVSCESRESGNERGETDTQDDSQSELSDTE